MSSATTRRPSKAVSGRVSPIQIRSSRQNSRDTRRSEARKTKTANERTAAVGTGEEPGGRGQTTVSRTTSSMEVTPSRSFCRPEPRSEIIPVSIALLRSSTADAPDRISSRTSSPTSITS